MKFGILKTRDKIFILGILAVSIFFTIHALYEKYVCDPEWLTIEENLEYIRRPNSVKQIDLYKAYDYPKTNLVEDTIKIVDKNDIDLIQEVINNRYTRTWNHAIPAWSVRMKLTLYNQKIIEFKISKIDNDTISNMTHLDFSSKHCSATLPSCSETLGTVLENVTSYNGINH